MKPMKLLFIGFFLFFFVFAAPAQADIKAVVNPSIISQGDAFIVRIEGAQTATASYNGLKLPVSVCEDGNLCAIGSVPLTAKPGNHVVVIRSDKKTLKADFTVSKLIPLVVHMTLPKEKVFISQEDTARDAKEKALLKEIFGKVTERKWRGEFTLPVQTESSTAFGTKRIMNKKHVSIHYGTDFRGKEGAAVQAVNSGRIVLVKDFFFGGMTVVVDHGDGIYSLCMHLSAVSVNEGDVVEKGAVIAQVGSTGRATGPHLHMSMKVLGTSVNPVSMPRLLH